MDMSEFPLRSRTRRASSWQCGSLACRRKILWWRSCPGRTSTGPVTGGWCRSLLPEDVLVVKSIGRLGRNYTEILDQWSFITKKREAAIVVLDMPLLDTRQSRDLTGTLISDIVLQLLSYVAQTERENIRQRQAEGIAAAKANGVRFGRKQMDMPAGFSSLAEEWGGGQVSARQAASRLGISHHTFLKYARIHVGG